MFIFKIPKKLFHHIHGKSRETFTRFTALNEDLKKCEVTRLRRAGSGPSKGIHSERIADEFFVTNNIPKTNIKRVYSELEPCELASQCKQLLQTEYKQATISYSYSYPGGVDNTIRVNSVNQRFLDLENLLK